MNKQLIQNILYAGHCLGICSDWSEKAVNDIIDKLKDNDFVYNNIDEEELDKLAFESIPKWCYDSGSDVFCETWEEAYKAGYRKAKEE